MIPFVVGVVIGIQLGVIAASIIVAAGRGER